MLSVLIFDSFSVTKKSSFSIWLTGGSYLLREYDLFTWNALPLCLRWVFFRTIWWSFMKRLIQPSFTMPGFSLSRLFNSTECLTSLSSCIYRSLFFSDSSERIFVEEEKYKLELLWLLEFSSSYMMTWRRLILPSSSYLTLAFVSKSSSYSLLCLIFFWIAFFRKSLMDLLSLKMF